MKRGHRTWFAAVAVTSAVAATALSCTTTATAAAAQPAPAPTYMIIDSTAFDALTVVNTVTGHVTALIKTPIEYGGWVSIAALGPLTFLAGDVDEYNRRCFGSNADSYYYRIQLTTLGTLRSMRRVLKPISGDIVASTTPPGGREVAYLLLPDVTGRYCFAPAPKLVIRSTVTGEIRASWTLYAFESVGSFGFDAGTTLLAGTYAYRYNRHGPVSLGQSSHLLPVAASGKVINKLPTVSAQGGPVALSPDGTTMYQIVQTSRPSSKVWLDPHPLAFALEAISLRTHKTIAIYHRWTSVWGVFDPYLALDPSGQYLVVVLHNSVGSVDVRTGQYAQLPNLTTAMTTGPLLQQGQGKFQEVAW
jgi:DNA-binding beta-propeller fold protein YncE